MERSFEPSARSRVKRFGELGHYDRAMIFQVLDCALIATIGYAIDGQSYATPTVFWREGDTLYWHGSSASRMIRAHSAGQDVCVSVMLMDGLVLARSPFNHSINYRSVMAFGRAEAITDRRRKIDLLDRFMMRYFPDRLETLRPTTAKELKATGVVSMNIEEASAKIAASGPTDEPGDAEFDCWAGVIPLSQRLGEPERAGDLKPSIAFPSGLGVYASGAVLDRVIGRLGSTKGS
jgi:nitroimidazol reductase NimA-like FMN-containing flavoprotein (pyridoxamine 5'-phosphate oxidase superfamily)